MTDSWVSAHIHFTRRAPSDPDRILRSVIGPLRHTVETAGAGRLFFIRYAEDGEHVRVRIAPARAGDEGIVRCLIEQAVSSAAADDSLPSLSIRWRVYEPEVERYGGPAALRVAECMFERSSALALSLLDGVGEESAGRGRRLGRALICMVILARTAIEERSGVADFFGYYGRAYLGTFASGPQAERHLGRFSAAYDAQSQTLTTFVADVLERIDVAEALGAAFDEYQRAALDYVKALRELAEAGHVKVGSTMFPPEAAFRRILPSIMHMHNNRLGVSIPMESYLAILAERAVLTLGVAAAP
jgi:thiopeptide-type bacteriocin biosynthesis protein